MASSFLASDMVFSGDNTDPYAAEDFISRFNALASAVKWNDAAKVRSVGMLLTGTVKDWFKTQNYTDWDTFCDAFKAFHNRHFSAEAAENALRQRKKLPTETFDTYFYDIIRLLKQAKITDVTKQVQWLTKGLSPAMATQLAARKPTTTAAVLAIFRGWEDLQHLMGLEHLHISASTTASKPPYPSQHEQEIQKLRHELHEKDQVIRALEAQYGPYQYRGRPPNSRSGSPSQRAHFTQDDDLTTTRYYDEDTNLPRTVSASSIYPSPDYDSDEWLPNSTIATVTTTSGLIPLIHVYVHGIPLLAMIDTGASNTIISPDRVLQLPGLLITEDSPPVFDYSGHQNKTFGCAALEIALQQGSPINIKAIITDHAQHTDIILGTDFCKARGLQLDFESNTVKFNERAPAAAGIISYQLPYWCQPGLPPQQQPNHEMTATEISDVDIFDIDAFIDKFTSPCQSTTMQIPINRPTSLNLAPKCSIQFKPPDNNKSPPPSPNPRSTNPRRTRPSYTMWLTLTMICISILLGVPGYCTQTFSPPRTTTAITASHAQNTGTLSILGSATLTGMSYSSIFLDRSHPPECTLSFKHPLDLLFSISPQKFTTSGLNPYLIPASTQLFITSIDPLQTACSLSLNMSSEISTIEINLQAAYRENPLRSLDTQSSHRTHLKCFVTFFHPSEEGAHPCTTSEQFSFTCPGKVAQRHITGLVRAVENFYSAAAYFFLANQQPSDCTGGYATVIAQVYREPTPRVTPRGRSTPSSGLTRQPRRMFSPSTARHRRSSLVSHDGSDHRSGHSAPTSTRRRQSPTRKRPHGRQSLASRSPSPRRRQSAKAPSPHHKQSPKAPSPPPTHGRQKFPSALTPSSSRTSSTSSSSACKATEVPSQTQSKAPPATAQASKVLCPIRRHRSPSGPPPTPGRNLEKSPLPAPPHTHRPSAPPPAHRPPSRKSQAQSSTPTTGHSHLPSNPPPPLINRQSPPAPAPPQVRLPAKPTATITKPPADDPPDTSASSFRVKCEARVSTWLSTMHAPPGRTLKPTPSGRTTAAPTQVDSIIGAFPTIPPTPSTPPAGQGTRQPLEQRLVNLFGLPSSATTTSGPPVPASVPVKKKKSSRQPPPGKTPKKIRPATIYVRPSIKESDLSRAVTPPLAPQLTPD